MDVCHLCNGLREVHVSCGICGNEMADKGKEMDYYDDYSPYMPTDLMKMEDGFPDTYSAHKCPHLFTCSKCGKNETILIKE
ncbi:hypothetical protein [Neobacillus terrae]|uniref:hypothetical protein n=1 Tax=Neobacillus terrae TaxID=3034837 RepID=UPI00140A52F1|nr:hypothetical protein [Neobacillus terrae]NHM31777.1 hypothetical protein [Neobacillus terrae]